MSHLKEFFFNFWETEAKPGTDEAGIRKEHGTQLKALQKACESSWSQNHTFTLEGFSYL